jgi:hypothetical protein
MTFDEQVKELRGKVVPQRTHKPKSTATPEEWAANLDYIKSVKQARPETARAWRAANKERTRTYQKRWKEANPEKAQAVITAAVRKRYQSDPAFRIMKNIRTRQGRFFRGTSRPFSMVRDMGCTQEFFLQHITSQLTDGMTLNNYGKFWHLDHIYPLSQANIIGNPAHFLAAVNWRNIQPMLGTENVGKSDQVSPEAQALFDLLVEKFAAAAQLRRN